MSDRLDLIIGATGLVGQALQVCGQGNPCLRAAVRAPAETRVPALTVDFERLDEFALEQPLGTLYCALGTTLRTAGSREAFRQVDVALVSAVARWAHRLGVRAMIVVSSVGADPASGNFYLRCKGEMEQAIGRLAIPLMVFVRPSLLLGPRAEFRLGEQMGQWGSRLASPLLLGGLRRYRPVTARQVARAMLRACTLPDGRHVLHYDQISSLAAEPETA